MSNTLSNSSFSSDFVVLNLLGFPVVVMEEGKTVPFASPESYGNPSVWWADSWEEYENVMGILSKCPTAQVYL